MEKIAYKKFINTIEINNYEILTPNGWINIEGIGKTIKFNEIIIKTFNDKQLICADKHILYKCINIDFYTSKCDLQETLTENLLVGDFIMTNNGPDMILEITKSNKMSHMYDLQISEGSNKQYYTNNILSHNSLWMQNLAVKSADLGNNILYITLEMSEKKVLKRLGSMRLKIPVNDYDVVSLDKEFIKDRISRLKNNSESDLFEKKVGKIIVKFWPAGTTTINDFDNFIQKFYEKRGMKFQLVIVDYITLIAPIKGLGSDNLYIKGKQLAEGLRALAAKYNFPLLSAIQVSKDAWDASDITLSNIPESKAIAETCDTFFAIIRNEEMKRQNKFRFKLLKQRDGDFLKSQINIDLNPTFLTLQNDVFIDGI